MEIILRRAEIPDDLVEFFEKVDQCPPSLSSVISIPAEPSDEAHYAAFPSALPELCILAGTSEKGCCATCGAPWVRVVNRTRGKSWHNHKDDLVVGQRFESNEMKGDNFYRNYKAPRTVDWRPSCKCENAGEPIGCVVADPFAGTSTTGVAALRLGRRFIGIELSSEYCQISERRLREAERNAIGDLFLPLQKAAHPTLF